MKPTFFAAAIAFGCSIACPASAGIDPAAARQYFDEAAALADGDAGRLWGRNLRGPMLFVDPATRSVVANQADGEGLLEPREGLWFGTLPEAVGVANHAVRWSGTHWTMLMWPLPNARYTRARLLMHESFHRVQDDLGLPAGNPANSHVDTMAGRLYLRLEWRALADAVLAESATRRAAAEDALLFRAARFQLVSADAADQERALNMNEGLAEFTGWRLCGLSNPAMASRVALVLEQNEWGGPFARNFSYTSGPAWAMLLDEFSPRWREGLTTKTDLPDLLAKAIGWTPPRDAVAAANDLLDRYRGVALRNSEQAREKTRLARIEAWKQRFFTGPVLVLPVGPDVNYSYNPNGVEGYDEASSVYASINLRDAWGVLEADGDAMVIRRNGTLAEVRVPAPKDLGVASGDGWKLTLQPGWRLVPGERGGDSSVRRE